MPCLAAPALAAPSLAVSPPPRMACAGEALSKRRTALKSMLEDATLLPKDCEAVEAQLRVVESKLSAGGVPRPSPSPCRHRLALLALCPTRPGVTRAGKRQAVPGETLASGKTSKGTVKGKSEGGAPRPPRLPTRALPALSAPALAVSPPPRPPRPMSARAVCRRGVTGQAAPRGGGGWPPAGRAHRVQVRRPPGRRPFACR